MTTTLTSRPLAPTGPSRPYERRRRLDVHQTLTKVVVGLIVVVQVYPLVWLILSSLRTEQDFASRDAFALPSSITFENYARAFETGNLGHNIVNSFVVTMGANLLIVLMGMMAAFALQVLGFRLSNLVRGLFLIGVIVPVQIALVPLFINYSRVGLLDTHASMIIPLAGFALPMSVYLFSSFYGYIPRETYEAASLDGAVGSSRVDLQACKLEYSIVSPK